MLEEELFSLFKGNTSAAAGVGRVGGVGAVQLPSQYSPCAGNHHHHAPAAPGAQHQVLAAETRVLDNISLQTSMTTFSES